MVILRRLSCRNMYPYVLGLHLKSSMLCRIPHPEIANYIPPGFVRVIFHASSLLRITDVSGQVDITKFKYSKLKINPYTIEGELKNPYWSLFRWQDLQRRHKEPVTGPTMLRLFLSTDEPI